MGSGRSRNPLLDVQGMQIARLLRGKLPRPARVLDLGCGAGLTTLQLFGARGLFDVVGGDISSVALDEYVKVTGRPGVRIDAERLAFDDFAFDVVVANDLVEHLVYTDTHARELRRVLKP